MVVAAECRFAVKNRETGGDAVRDMEDDFFEEDDDSESELVGVLCTPFPTSSQRRLQSSPRESDIRKAAPTVRDSKNSSLPSSRACKVAKVHPSETRLEPEDVRNTKGSGSKSSGRGKGSQRLPVIKEVPSRENSESKPLHRDCPELQSEHKGWRLGTTVLPVESSQSDECDEDEDDIFSENFMGSKSGGNKPSMAEEKDVILGDAQVVPDDVVVGEEIPPDEVEGKSAADAKVASGDAENVDEEIPCGSAASSKSEPTSEPPTVPRKDRRAPEKEDRIDDPAIAISVYDLIPETQTPSEGSQAEAAEASPLSGFHPEETPKQFESAAEGSEQHNDQDHLRAADVSPAENIGAESKVAHELDETAEHTRQEELKSEFYRSEFYGTATESPSPPPEMRMKPSNSGASPARQADAGRSDTRPGSELPCAAESRQRETSLSPDQESEQGSIDDFVAPPEASKGFITARGRGVTISDNGRKKAEEVLGDLSALAQAAPSQSTTRLTERTPLSEVQISAAAAVASTSLCPSHSGSRVLSSSARTTSENVTVNALDADVQTILPSSDRSTEDQMFVGSSTDRGKAGGKLEFKRERAFSSDAFGRDSKVASERDEPVGLDQQRLQRDAFQSEFYDGPEAESLNKCVPRGGFTAGFSVGQGKVMQELGLEEARCAAPMPSENVEAPSEGFATGSGCGKATELSDESVKGATQLANSDKEQGSVLVMVQPPADTTKGARATTGVKTGRGNGFHVSEDSQTKVEQLLGDDAQPDSGLQFSPVGEREARFAAPAHSENVEALAGGLGGFATGRGKVLKVSEDGLKRASALFGDLNGEGVGSGPAMAQAPIDSAKGASGSRESIRKGSGDGFFVPESALRRTGQLLDQEDQPDPSVQFSQSSKQPFEEKEEASMALPVHSENVGAPAGGLGGFATGRGKALKVSEDGLKRASAPFGDLNGEGVGSGPAMAQAPIDSAKGASGSRESFSTGRGNSVKNSESALRRTGQLLGDQDQPDPSAQLSQSSKRPFEEEEEASMVLQMHSENVGAPAGGLGGFATGRGKTLELSEDGLKRASALFGDLNGNEEGGSEVSVAQPPIKKPKAASSGSFSTGRGGGVHISESALRKTGQLFGDQDQPDSKAQGSERSKGKEPAIFNTPFNHERPSHNTLSERATVHRAQPQSFSILKTSSSTASGVGLVTPAPKRSAETASFSSTAAPKSRRPFKAPRLLNQTPVTPAGNAAGQAAGHSRSQQTPAPFCVTPLRDSGEGGKTMPSIQRRISSASNVTPQLLFSSPESDSQIRAMSKTLNFKGFTSSEDFIRRMQHAVPLSLCQAVHGQTPFSDESNGNIEIAEYMKIVSVTSSNAAAFRLSASGSHFFDSEHADPAGRVGAEDMLRVLASNHQKSTDLTAEWVANHYRWIVWKLAAMERAFPSIFGGNYLTPDRVYLQLLNRFDREVVRGERSIVKEILDRDQVANHPMVLCVSHAVQKSDDSVHLMLTDGWHEIGANIDPELTRLATCGKLFVGQKLRIFGADRDMDESKPVTLKLTINGVSRAKWDEKLGRTKEAPCLGLRCIRPGGGLVPAVRVVVQRIFPKVYMESCGDGTKLWRSEAVEVKTQQEYEDRVNREWEKFLGKKMDSNQLGHSSEADGGQEGDMAEQAHEREKQMNSWRESFMEQDAMTLRKVCAVLKMRVSCLHPAQAGHAGGDALLTWWRPGEAMASIQEGSAFVIRNVQANDMRKGGLPCLSFMKETRCTPVEDPRVASVYRPRRVVGVEDIGSCNLEDDLDVCGAVVEVSEVVMDIGRSGLPCHKQHVILTGPSLLSLQDEDVETCMDAQFRTCYLRVELGVDSIMPLRLSASQLPCVLTIRNLSRPRQLRETGSVKVYSCQANAEAEISQSPPAKPRHAAAQQKQTLDSHAWEAIRAWTDRSRDEIMSGEVSLANLTW